MLKFFVLTAIGFLCIDTCIAQNIGILPLTGMRYYKEGIWAKSIDIKIDGSQLLSNRIPLNKEIELVLQQPTGFTVGTDKNKTSFAAAEFILSTTKGDIILKTPNLLLKNEATGFTAKDFKALSMKFVLTQDLMKTNTSGILKFRLFDLKSKNQLRLEFQVNITKYGEVVQVSKLVKAIKAPPGAMALTSGVKVKNMYLTVDTTIKVNAKMAFASVDLTGIEGTSLGGIFDGKENFWVYDTAMNEIKITDILLKQVGGALENNNVDYTLKIPFRLKKAAPKGYIVRFRWESPDKTQVIDLVVTI